MKNFWGYLRQKHRFIQLLGALLLAMTAMLFTSPVERTAAQDTSAAEGTKVIVLNYHKVDNIHNSLSVIPEDFERQMRYLSENGYNTITPEQLYDNITTGAELPEKPILITFDDGYQDNYDNAYPILKKYNMKATIFVVTGFLGKHKNYLTWEEAKELENSGISIESHTLNHKSMTELSDEQLRVELVNSRIDIKEKLGKESYFMAYPTGTYNLHIANMVKEAGYKGAFTIKYGNADGNTNVYAIERIPIFHTENTNKDFFQRLKYIPLFQKLGWKKS